MAIDLITGHQGVAHISAEQIAELQRAELGGYGNNKVMRMIDGGVTYAGLTITVAAGYWRVNGYDMQIQEAEEILIDPTAAGMSRIDKVYATILQDIPSGVQRSELRVVQGEESASTPTAPTKPTAPILNTDELLQIEEVCTVTVSDGAMTFTDNTIPYELANPDAIDDIVNVYGAKNLIPYPYYDPSGRTNRGITYTYDEEGIITANGSSDTTNQSLLVLNHGSQGLVLFSTKKYTLTCERTNDNNKGFAVVYFKNADNTDRTVSTHAVYEDGTTRNANNNYVSLLYSGVMHTSVTFWVDTDTIYTAQARFNSNSGTITNAILKPMLRLASIQDDTYVPYAKTNKQLTDDSANKVDLTNISITGSTNNAGVPIPSGKFFYKDGVLVRAKTTIAEGATLTLNTNYRLVTAGALNDLYLSLGDESHASAVSGSTAFDKIATLNASLTNSIISPNSTYSNYLGVNLVNNDYTVPNDGIYIFMIYAINASTAILNVKIDNNVYPLAINNSNSAILISIPLKKDVILRGSTNNTAVVRLDYIVS